MARRSARPTLSARRFERVRTRQVMKCRGHHVLALTSKGQLWAWGRNEDGQLGYAKAKTPGAVVREHQNYATPERVAGLMGTRVRHIACGRTHSIAVDADGRLHSWGGNDDGALGHGDRVSRAAPTLCEALAGVVVVGVACGSRHTLALVIDTSERAPAADERSRGGFGAGVARAYSSLAPSDGTLFSWGWGAYGQLGHGDVSNRLEPALVAALEAVPIGQLACGYRHSMVVAATEPREVWAWGWGHDGQLGTGTLKDEILPQSVDGLPATGRIELRLGGRHSLALCDDGKVYAWGKDDDGQLGLGVVSKSTPTRIDALRSASVAFEVVDANCGWAHTALLVSFPEPRDPIRSSREGASRGSLSAPREAKVPGFASLKRRLSVGLTGSIDGKAVRYPRLFSAGDYEGLFGQVRLLRIASDCSGYYFGLLRIASDYFRLLLIASECFGVLRSASDCFGLLRSASDCFGLLRGAFSTSKASSGR